MRRRPRKGKASRVGRVSTCKCVFWPAKRVPHVLRHKPQRQPLEECWGGGVDADEAAGAAGGSGNGGARSAPLLGDEGSKQTAGALRLRELREEGGGRAGGLRAKRAARGADSSDGAGDGAGVRALCSALRAHCGGLNAGPRAAAGAAAAAGSWLRVLKLRGHAVTAAATRAAAAWLASPGCRVEELDLGNCGLGDERLAVSE